MIILATAVVLTLSNSGIISKANDAVDATDLANMQDLASTLWADKYLDLRLEDGVIDDEALAELKKAVEEGLINADKNYASKYNVDVTLEGVTVTKAEALNKYGFYFDAPYAWFNEAGQPEEIYVFKADGSVEFYAMVADKSSWDYAIIYNFMPRGMAVYENKKITLDGEWVAKVEDDGRLLNTPDGDLELQSVEYHGVYRNRTYSVTDEYGRTYVFKIDDKNKVTIKIDQTVIAPVTYISDGNDRAFINEDEGYMFFVSVNGKSVLMVSEGEYEVVLTLDEINKDMTSVDITKLTPGLYQTGSNYTILLKDWETLVNEGYLRIEEGVLYDGEQHANTVPTSITDPGEVKLTLLTSEQSTEKCGMYGELVLPADGSITTIGDKAFYCCTNLKGIVLPNGVTSIGKSAFKNSTINYIILPDGLTSIGKEAFSYIGVKNIVLPSSLSVIEEQVFDASGIIRIDIPEGVTSIGNSAFRNCSALKEITLPNSLQEIGAYAFSRCINLGDVIIPKNVEKIGLRSFYVCEKIEKIVLHNKLTTIDLSAFAACDALSEVYYTGSQTEWNNITIKSENDPLINAVKYYNYVTNK